MRPIRSTARRLSNMIQEHTARMEQYLTPEERFTQAVLQDNRPVLEQMKNEGFTPSSRLLESVAANHPTLLTIRVPADMAMKARFFRAS